jgi:hypothetical protein
MESKIKHMTVNFGQRFRVILVLSFLSTLIGSIECVQIGSKV